MTLADRLRIPSPVVRWRARTFESLSDRNLRILWFGTLINFLAVAMSATVHGIVAFDLTGNSRAVGAVLLGQGIALFVVSPFGGALADRVSKRSMLIACQAIVCVAFALLGTAVVYDVINIPMLAVGAFVSAMMFSMIRSVRNAYTGELAPPELRGNAVAVQQLAISVMQILAPLVAGILLGLSFVGAAGTYFVMSGTFVITVCLMFLLPRTTAPTRSTRGASAILRETWGGLRYGWSHPEIQWVLGGFVLLTITGMPYLTLLPGYADHELGVSTARLGLLLGISAFGGLIISLVSATAVETRLAAPLLAACNVTFGLGLLGLAVAPGFAAAAVAAFFVGAGASGFQVLNLAVALRAADLAYMGRVAALTVMAASLSGLVALPVGALADAHGERPMLAAMGVGVLVVSVVLVGWRLRAAARQRVAA